MDAEKDLALYAIGAALTYWQLIYWRYDDKDFARPPAAFIAILWPMCLVVGTFFLGGVALYKSAEWVRQAAKGDNPDGR
jgi:hypothetical protein